MSLRASENVAVAPQRELCFLALCHLDKVAPAQRNEALALFFSVGSGAVEGAAGVISTLAADDRTLQAAKTLMTVLIDHGAEIDAVIEKTSERWRLVRMDVTDRNCMRLATGELMCTKANKRAIVGDAVRLASRYGSERSARFVNGVVEAIARVLRGGDDGSESP